MIVINIPRDVRDMQFNTTLDGVDYILRLKWNPRAGWFLGMQDVNGVVLSAPRACVVSMDWLSPIRWDPRCPPGLLMFYEVQPGTGNPGYRDLVRDVEGDTYDGKVALLYFTQADLVVDVFGA